MNGQTGIMTKVNLYELMPILPMKSAAFKEAIPLKKLTICHVCIVIYRL